MNNNITTTTADPASVKSNPSAELPLPAVKQSKFSQSKLTTTSPNPYVNEELNIAICDLIWSNNSSLLLIDDLKTCFCTCLSLYLNYNIPSHQQLSKNLMDTFYSIVYNDTLAYLQKQVNIFVNTICDGLTIKNIPMVNVMASEVYKPVAAIIIIAFARSTCQGL